MHTNSLPISLNAPVAPASNPRANSLPASGGVDFGATLTRQMEQRQLEQRRTMLQPQAAAPAPQAAPKPQAPAKPAANDARSAPREMVRQAAQETAHPETTKQAEGTQGSAAEEKTTAAADGESTDDETSADARVADSVVDMLALVASFNQAQQAAAPAPPATQAPAVQAMGDDSLLSNMKEVRGEGAEALAKLKGDAGLAAVTEESQNQAESGVDLRALDLGKVADTAKPPLEAGDFAARLRDTTAQAGMKEAAPGPDALTSLTAQATALQTAQAAGSAPTDRLSARVGTPAWDNQVGQKVIWMVGGEDQSATLELNPPDLGPVQVVLNVSNDLASVTFSSQQLEVRQALENALPRLREMMSESGIALGNATVNAGAEGRQGQDGQGAGGSGRGRGGHGGGGDSDVAEVAPRQRTRVIGGAGAVDTFA